MRDREIYHSVSVFETICQHGNSSSGTEIKEDLFIELSSVGYYKVEIIPSLFIYIPHPEEPLSYHPFEMFTEFLNNSGFTIMANNKTVSNGSGFNLYLTDNYNFSNFYFMSVNPRETNVKIEALFSNPPKIGAIFTINPGDLDLSQNGFKYMVNILVRGAIRTTPEEGAIIIE